MHTRIVRAALVAVCCLASVAFSATVAHAQAGLKVIVNSASPVTELSGSEVSNIFLKKKNKFPSGDAATPIDQSKGSTARAAFAKAIHGRAASAVDTYWQQQIFAGGESPPATKSSDDEIVAFVKSTPGAIGYVSDGANVSGVKVVTVK